MKKFLALILALTMILALCACGEAAAAYEYPELTLQWGTTSSEGTIIVDAMNEFAAKVKEASDGKITVEIYPGSVLGSSNDMFEQCQLGTLSMCMASPVWLSNLGATPMIVLNMPYLFSGFDQRWNVVYGEIGDELKDLVNEKVEGLVGFSYIADGARHFFTNFDVKSVADLQGKKLRVQSNELDSDWCSALGAIPTPTATSEMYQALATGIVDGAEQPIANYVAGKYTEVSKYLVLDGHTYNTMMVCFNEAIWNSLDAETQNLLSLTWDEVIQGKKETFKSTETGLLDDIKAAGVTVIEPTDLDDWAACMEPVYEKYSAQYGFADYITRIKEVKG